MVSPRVYLSRCACGRDLSRPYEVSMCFFTRFFFILLLIVLGSHSRSSRGNRRWRCRSRRWFLRACGLRCCRHPLRRPGGALLFHFSSIMRVPYIVGILISSFSFPYFCASNFVIYSSFTVSVVEMRRSGNPIFSNIWSLRVSRDCCASLS